MRTFIFASVMACRIINGSLLVFNIIVNLFYIFCLIFPSEAGQRKQPLTLLLGFLILSSLSYSVSLVIQGIYGLLDEFTFIFSSTTDYSVDFSMVSYVWLNFYYYIQIVPAPFALFHWVKRNIKSTICVLLGFDILITILSRITVYVFYVTILSSPGNPFNHTLWQDFKKIQTCSVYMIMMHYIVLLCVTVVSSFSTVCYLHNHMKNMGKMGTSISAARLRGQMRVTITGMFQGVLFFLHANYLLLDGFTKENSNFFLDTNIRYTITTVFISGTTVTLGIGQNVFRQRIVVMYKALKSVSL